MHIEDTSAAIKAKSKKLPIIIAAAAVVVIAAVLLIILGGKGGGKKAAGGYESFSPDVIYITGDTVYSRTAGKLIELEDDSYYVMADSLDGSKKVLYDYNEEKLSLVGKDGQKEITDSEVNACEMSLDGSTVVYLEKVSSSKANLMKYSVKSGKSEQLAEIKDKAGNPIAVSPDGGSVLYVNDGDLFTCIKGKINETGEEGIPVGISDGGKYVYFTKEVKGKTRLCVIAGGETKKIAETGNSYCAAYFNRTLSEVVFEDSYSDAMYFSANGSEGEKIKNYDVYPYGKEAYVVFDNSTFKAILGRGSFIGTACVSGSEIRVLTSELKSEKAASKAAAACVFNGGKSAVYVDSKDNLYYIKDITKLGAEPQKIAEDIETSRLWVTPDGSLIYYVNEDDELHAITFSGKDTRCAEDVTGYYIVMDPQTGNMYYISDGDLFSVAGAAKAEKVKLKKDASYINVRSGVLIVTDVNNAEYLLLADGTFEKMG